MTLFRKLNIYHRKTCGIIAAIFLAFLTVISLPAYAFADEGPLAPIAQQGTSHSLTITPVVWTILSGLAFPVVFNFLTKANRSPKVKAILAIVGSAFVAVVERSQLADGSAVISSGLLLDTLLVYGPQLMAYIGIYSKFDLKSKTAPNFGV